jgi:hypothetical protein
MELNRRVKILLKHMVENQNMPLTQKKKKKKKGNIGAYLCLKWRAQVFPSLNV